MQDFAQWFCLKGRQNFTIDPQINRSDAQYYFGRHDIKILLEKQLRRAFIDPGVPKMMVYGPYGSGKTQTLFYLEHYLRNQPIPSIQGFTPHTVYLTVELRSNSTASGLHMQIMEALGKDVVSGWVRKLFETRGNFDQTILEIAYEDPNVYRALKELRATGESTFTAWRWLTGQNFSSRELSGLGITRSLGELGSGDLASALIAIGNLASKVDEKIIFLIDEMEQLQNVKSGDAAESIHRYIRKLAEKANASVGFLIGFKADVIDDAPEILRRGDISSRVNPSNYLDIPHLPAVADVQSFMGDLLKNLTDATLVNARLASNSLSVGHGVFPFEQYAFEMLADYAAQDPTRALPRNIISAINECAIQAWDEQKQLIDSGIVDEVAPRIFQQI
jgi:hypothetical protein